MIFGKHSGYIVIDSHLNVIYFLHKNNNHDEFK